MKKRVFIRNSINKLMIINIQKIIYVTLLLDKSTTAPYYNT